MFNLMIKDLLIQKKYVLYAYIYMLALIFAFQNLETFMFTSVAVGFVYILLTTSCAYDERNKADTMINSLPVKRSHVVTAKYLAVYMFLAMVTLGYWVFSNLLSILELPIEIYPITVDIFIAGLVAVSIMTGLFLPIYFKFGFTKSRVVSLVLFFGFFFAVPLIMKALHEWEIANLNGSITSMLKFHGKYTGEVLEVFGLLIFMFLSHRLSLVFYRNREF